MLGSGQELVRLPFAFPKSIRLNVTNETMKEEDLLVTWQLRNADGSIVRREECPVHVPALTSVWLDRTELPEAELYSQYVSYQAYKDDVCVSEGTVIFSYPKYFRYEDPCLKAEVHGNLLTISASAYAARVEIQNENEDLVLSDNYFDMNAGTKTVEILGGSTEHLRLRSVYDIH